MLGIAVHNRVKDVPKMKACASSSKVACTPAKFFICSFREHNQSNSELARTYIDLLARHGGALQVKGHSGEEGNDVADKMARYAQNGGSQNEGVTNTTWPSL